MLTSNGLDVVVGRALGTVLVTVRGPLRRECAPELAAQLDEVLDERPERVVIDLTGLTAVDESGTHALTAAKQAADAARIELQLTSRRAEVLAALGPVVTEIPLV
jgi:anti-anti-sigma regulatory factor